MLTFSAFFAALAMNVQSAWNYEERGNNVTHWKQLYAECGYSRQSPIDIPAEALSAGATCETPLKLEWTSEASHYAIRNSGHSLKAVPFLIDHAGGDDLGSLEVLHHTNDTNIRLTNKFYTSYESLVHDEYCFDSLHFHWGRTNDEGSEHTINGKAYPLEMHLVHYSCSYDIAGAALTDYATGKANVKYDDDNVLAVIGVMFEIGAPNPVLGRILNEVIVDNIYQNKAQDFPDYLELFYAEFDVKELLPESREMFSYLGSLTTPPCYETVRWHLLKEAMTVSEEQMALLRRLLEGTDEQEMQAPNFRPPQPLNDRKIWACQEDVDEDLVFEDKRIEDAEQDSEAQKEWKNIAIAFIVLFAVLLIVFVVVTLYLRSALSQSQKTRAGTESQIVGTNEARMTNDDSNEPVV